MAKRESTQNVSFERNLEQLERVVEQLESGELELADSLDRFKQGIELSGECRKMLDRAQQTVESLIDTDQESEPGQQPAGS
ncbi:MAG: exodeoxyribonuclease VII small subunit [Xanthomonadaceae bacterium]|nr:exodeoxyribonuclease VII small subunit [Xanthomonadaceae bacterium]